MTPRILHGILVAVLCALMPVGAWAQTSTVKGTVVELDGGQAVAGASVSLLRADSSRAGGTYTSRTGGFTLKSVPNGAYTLRVSVVGFATMDVPISVPTPEDVAVKLDRTSVTKDAVVVTASRAQEKALDAPASISVVSQRDIVERPTLSPVDQVREQAGVDYAESGLSQRTVNVRGFNDVFTGTLLTLNDYRVTGVPSLRVNIPYFVPVINDDIERIELVRGPGSALFGPNASQGVMNIITRSPFSSTGTSAFVGAGERDVFTFGARQASKITEDVAFRISAQYFTGHDWEYIDPVEQQARDAAIAEGASPDTLRIGDRDFTQTRYTIDGRFDFMVGEESQLTVGGGIANDISSIEMTGIGAAQGQEWMYTYGQIQYRSGELFAQTFFNKSDAGQTYLLRTGEPIVDRSTLFGARLQHANNPASNWRLTYGGDFFSTNPETDGTITGVNEENDSFWELGGYIQSDYNIESLNLMFIATLRADYHSVVEEPVFSPRVGFVYSLSDAQTVRVTYNRAFTTPTTNNMFLDLVAAQDAFGLSAFVPSWAVAVRAQSPGREGLTFTQRDAYGAKFRSQFSTDKSSYYSRSEVTNFWGAASNILIGVFGRDTTLTAEQKSLLTQFLTNLPAPGTGTIGTDLGMLNTTTATFDRSVQDVYDAPKIQPTITQTIEIGYKGVIDEKLSIGVDVYYNWIEDFITSLNVFTPNVFMKFADVRGYIQPALKQALMSQGVPEDQATAMAAEYSLRLAAGYANIPMGVVSPDQAVDPTAVLLTYRNYGNVQYWGTDISLGYQLTHALQVRGAYSYMSDDHFVIAEGDTLQMNAPKNKFMVGAAYRIGEWGLLVGANYRYNGGFKMNSGVYYGVIDPYGLVDLNMTWDMSFVRGLQLNVNVSNLLDNKIQQFIGAPVIGRMAMARLNYVF